MKKCALRAGPPQERARYGRKGKRRTLTQLIKVDLRQLVLMTQRLLRLVVMRRTLHPSQVGSWGPGALALHHSRMLIRRLLGSDNQAIPPTSTRNGSTWRSAVREGGRAPTEGGRRSQVAPVVRDSGSADLQLGRNGSHSAPVVSRDVEGLCKRVSRACMRAFLGFDRTRPGHVSACAEELLLIARDADGSDGRLSPPACSREGSEGLLRPCRLLPACTRTRFVDLTGFELTTSRSILKTMPLVRRSS